MPLLHDSGVKRILLLGPQEDAVTGLPDYVEWRSAFNPEMNADSTFFRRFFRSLLIRVRSVCGWDYPALAYRFNEIHGFRSHQIKKQLPRVRWAREALAGNYVATRWSRYLARNRWLYKLFYRICYASLYLPHPSISRFFASTPVDRLVLWHVQSALNVEYSLCARNYDIQTIGVLGSWDRPTTKGPLCPGISRFCVNSLLMKNELERYHAIAPTAITVTGWPHLDAYHVPATFLSQLQFRHKIGVSSATRLLLFAANSPRLGGHEPDLLAALAAVVQSGRFGKDRCLLVRPHPADGQWQDRFSAIDALPNVHLMPAELGHVDWLANLLKYSDVVISTQGTITLDAVALDKPVINIGFAVDEASDQNFAVDWMYEMDHYQPVIASGGVQLVHSMEALCHAIEQYLENPDQDAAGREQLRAWQLGPFDGHSSEWTVKAILDDTDQAV